MQKRILNILLFILSIIALISPAISNKYPLAYSDTGTYIWSGYDAFVPLDRPIVYGLFIRNIPISSTLWSVVIMQAIFVTTIILICFKNLIKFRHNYLATFLTILFLSFTTGLSNYVSQIMPDIFAAIAIISIGLLFTVPSLSVKARLSLSILVIFSIIVHTSNLLTTAGLILLYLIISLIFFKRKIILLKPALFIVTILVTLSAWLVLPAINNAYGYGFKLARTTNIFLMGHLIETGILSTYLDDNCESHKTNLCDIKDKFHINSPQFLWDPTSPLYDNDCDKNGGWTNCWIQKDKEYAPIVHDIITTPKYLKLLFMTSLQGAYRQLTCFDVGRMDPMNEGSPVMGIVGKFYSKDFKSYNNTKQAKAKPYFYLETLTMIQNFVIAFSLIGLMFFFFIGKQRKLITVNIKIFCMITFIGVIINAITCSTFAMVANRFEGRVIWILPFLVILLFVNKISQRQEVKT